MTARRRSEETDEAVTASGEAPGRPGPPPIKPSGDGTPWLLPVFGLVVGACATLPVLVGPQLDVAYDVEIADHLIPGLVILAVSAVVLLVARSVSVSGSYLLAAGLVVDLAALWMVATHLPLVAQAVRGDAPWGATIYHSASAVLMLGLGIGWTKTHWAGG